jgi:hypothetical protein
VAVPGLEVSAGIAPLDDGDDAFARALAEARRSARPLVAVALPAHDLGADTCRVSGVETALAGRSGPDSDARQSPMTRRRAVADAAEPEAAGVVLERRTDRIGAATPSGRFKGYVGVVCADGDGVGARFAAKRRPRELREESVLVHDAVEAAERSAYAAAVDAHVGLGASAPLPVNPVIRAGDDLRFVVPAHVALAFALVAVLGSEAQAVEAPTCTAGNYLEDGACVPADPGHFVADGAEAREKCASGEYQDQPGQSSCKVIGEGSEATGADPDGLAATGVRQCPVGRYQDQPGQSSCKDIPLGSGGVGGQADGTGSTSSVLCEPGTFRGDAGTTKCATAAVGTFVSTTGAQVWTICEVGQ